MSEMTMTFNKFSLNQKVFAFDWQTLTPLERTIGQVRVVQSREKVEVSYMCDETGIGSGQVYMEEDLSDTLSGIQTRIEHLRLKRKAQEKVGLQLA